MNKIIKRNLLRVLKNHLDQKEITFIVGPRQAGKTTLMLRLKEYLEKKAQKTIFLSLDIEADKEFFTTQAKLIQKINLEIGKDRGFVFIDEIQRKENAGIFLKGIYDMNLPYKFIVSGSGSIELKEKIHESLVGRKRMFELTTLTFEEFVNFKTENKYENRLLDFFAAEEAKINQFLLEYLNFGGYPRVVLAETLGEKTEIINDIYQSYIEKDISYLLGIKKTDSLTGLIKLMSSQIGSLVNYSKLSLTLGISVQTVKNYLWYLEKTFILKKISPYFKNIRKEITKSPIFYFNDLGLRNYIIGDFGRLADAAELGFLFQNFIFLALSENFLNASKIHFWRTKDKAEVDFVIDEGKNLIPIEIKYKRLKDHKISPALNNFIKKYQPKRALIVNLSLKDNFILDDTEIFVIPFWELAEVLRGSH